MEIYIEIPACAATPPLNVQIFNNACCNAGQVLLIKSVVELVI